MVILAGLEAFLGPLGAILAPLGVILAPLGVILGPLGTILGPLRSSPKATGEFRRAASLANRGGPGPPKKAFAKAKAKATQ